MELKNVIYADECGIKKRTTSECYCFWSETSYFLNNDEICKCLSMALTHIIWIFQKYEIVLHLVLFECEKDMETNSTFVTHS